VTSAPTSKEARMKLLVFVRRRLIDGLNSLIAGAVLNSELLTCYREKLLRSGVSSSACRISSAS
jgi:hypothetical protein